MAAPVQPGTPPSPENQPGAAGVTFDEMETQLQQQEAALLRPDLSKVTMEGDDVPEGLKGKNAMDAIRRVQELERALQASEVARQQALATAQIAASRPQQPAPVVKEPEPEPQITPQMVAEAFSEDTSKGVELMTKMQQQAIDRAAASFGQRIEPLLSGTVSAVEAEARRRYPDEFEIYKDEIQATLSKIPNKQVMSTQDSWDDLVAYVRGKDPMKLFSHMQKKEEAVRQTQAQQEQRNLVGYTATTGQRPPAPSVSGVVIDETVKEVCKVMGISEADYAKWARVG